MHIRFGNLQKTRNIAYVRVLLCSRIHIFRRTLSIKHALPQKYGGERRTPVCLNSLREYDTIMCRSSQAAAAATCALKLSTPDDEPYTSTSAPLHLARHAACRTRAAGRCHVSTFVTAAIVMHCCCHTNDVLEELAVSFPVKFCSHTFPRI